MKTILLHDCSIKGFIERKDEYDVVDEEDGKILFTGTAAECKLKYLEYLEDESRRNNSRI